LRKLFDIYETEETTKKAPATQAHDRRCFEMFCRCFGGATRPESISVRELNRFIADRRTGRIAPAGIDKRRVVGNRIIQSDLSLLSAVFNFGTRAGDGKGGVLLERNPLRGLPMPKNESPARPALTEAQYTAVRKAAVKVGTWAELMVVIAHDSGHRAASVRQLRWSDVDLPGARIHWRAEADKIKHDHFTPATAEIVELLTRERNSRQAIGDAYIFPARRGDRSKPMSGDGVFNLWKRLAVAAELPEGRRFGWHSLRRKFATDLRNTNLRDLCDLGGWKSSATLLTCYITPDEKSQRTALAERPRKAAIS
jgi:integrase